VAEEKLSLQELEVRLKEQELKLKEAEVLTKERDLAASKWLNPVVIGLFAAALGLAGNVIVTTINSTNTQELERFRTRSTVILEAIRTNGDTNAACKNLVFFVSLGLIEDTNHTITGACPGNVQGVPSFSVGPPDKLGRTFFYPLRVQTVDNNSAPISDVKVEANLVPSSPPLIDPEWLDGPSDHSGYEWILNQTSSRCMTGKDGGCSLGMAPSGRFIVILAKKNGYVGNRTNTLFTGTSVVVVLQKNPRNP
jgi:hypothetical protein